MAKRILVVDDDVAFAEMLQIALSSAGYQVEVCLDAMAALGAIRRYQPDLVTLDVMMPGRSGWEIARDLCSDEQLSATAVIMMTGWRNDRELASMPGNRGPHGVLLKPFELDELYRMVANLLGRTT